MGFVARLFNVFVSPRETFEAVRERPAWVVPFIIIILITAGTTYFMTPLTADMQKDLIENRMENMGASDEQIEDALERAEGNQIAGVIGGAVSVAIMLIVGGLIWLFVSNTILGGEATFGQMMGVNVYRYFIMLVGLLIKLPIMLSQQTINIHFSLAKLFMDEASMNTFLYKFLANIELFNLWSIAVLIVGIATVIRVNISKVWPWAAVLFLIYYLAVSGIQSAIGF